MVTIAIIAAGAMGSAVGRKLVQNGCTVLTNLDGRSESTRRRAKDAGMSDASYITIAKDAQFLLSILPPKDAFSFAESFAETARSVGSSVLFADCNAVNPVSAQKIAEIFSGSGMAFVDAGIIGGPPLADGTYDPVFYASGDDVDALAKFDGLSKYGLKTSVLEGGGAGIGDASALKMSYAGITKGTTALMATMILAAHKSSPATAKALMNELHHSQPVLLNRLGNVIPSMIPKSYRWIAEMEEISAFVGEGEADIYQGIAKLFSRVENSLKGSREDVDVLQDFAAESKKLYL